MSISMSRAGVAGSIFAGTGFDVPLVISSVQIDDEDRGMASGIGMLISSDSFPSGFDL